MDTRLRVDLLGPLQVTVAGERVGAGGSLRRSLLALLALRPGEVIGVGTLVDGLWGDDPPQSATGVLQTYVSTWRKAFTVADEGLRIATVGAGYRLHLEEDETDLSQFVRLAGDGQRLVEQGHPHEARKVLEQALALWRGPALADLADRPFHASAVRPVEERRDRIVEDWAELVLRTGTDDDLAAVTARLQELSAARPWRERTSELLMWALFRQSRQRDALELFDQTRRRLAEELGIDPGPALRAMHERVLRQDPALGAAPAASRRTRRPPRLDSFVGRDRELGEVRHLLHGARLVTLTGPGGSGKTRLAEEVAADVATAGADTAVVELAPVEDVALVPGAVSSRLELGAAESVEVLASALADRPLLLVLDNLEQIPGVGSAVAALLRGTTALRVLATSREPLRVAGEHVYPVDPLPVPAAGERDPQRVAATPSVALLLDRARDRGRVDEVDPAALRDVVRSLDGLPLALEIVAPWVGLLGAAAVLGELPRSLDLTTRRSDADERHRTLRAAVAWSHDRLSGDEQRLLRRLAVLRGGGDLDAVRALAGNDPGRPAPDVLMDLLDRNLVGRAEPIDGAPRFRLLETVRQFAGERLDEAGEREATELRAAEHFAAWAVQLAKHSEGVDSEPWVVRAVADADNLRAAMDVLDREGRADEHLQLVVDTVALWFSAGLEGEGLRRLTRSVEKASADAPARPVGLTFQSLFTGPFDLGAALRLAEEATALARATGDDEALAIALSWLGDIAPDAEIARSANEELFVLTELLRGRPVRYAQGSPDFLATEAAGNLGLHARYRSMATAIEWQRQAVTWAERWGDRRGVAGQLAELSRYHLYAGDPETAAAVFGQVEGMQRSGLPGRTEDVIAVISAQLHQYAGRAREAEEAARMIIEKGLEAGRLLHPHYASCLLADLLVDRGAVDEVDAVLRRAERLLPESPDLRHVVRLRARRARWLRLTGRRAEAASMLDETEKGLDPEALALEHIIWLVEHALLADDPDESRSWLARLEDLSQRTGVAIPPWERRLLAGCGC